MKPAPFDYSAPEETEDVLALLREHVDAGKVLAGGQSLVPLLALRLARFDMLIDINSVGALSGVERSNGELVIGATTRQADIARDELIRRDVPMLAEATRYIGHFQIRNRGTIGGAIAHADPTAEYPAAALALDAEIELASHRGRRRIPIDDFLVSAYVTAIEPDELVVAIRVPVPSLRVGFAIEEIARRPGDFALVGGVATIALDEHDAITQARVVMFGVGPRPARLTELEDEIVGRRELPADLEASSRAVASALSPPNDVQATAAYRRDVAGPLAARVIASAWARAQASPAAEVSR
jgi:aerobic carbon-monoxide dehydrogenase medium subunit